MACSGTSDCRVWNPMKTREYRVGHNEIRGGDLAPENRGMIELNSDLRPLLTPQRRSFMYPRFFNSGCATPYCANAGQCPGGKKTGSSEGSKNLPTLYYQMPYDDNYAAVNGPTPIALSTLGQKINYSTANWYNLASMQAAPYAKCDLLGSDGCSNRYYGINSLPDNRTCACAHTP